MTTIQIRDWNRALFKAVVAAGFELLAKEAWMQNNQAQVKRLETLADDLRRQLQRPREDRRGPLQPPVATMSP